MVTLKASDDADAKEDTEEASDDAAAEETSEDAEWSEIQKYEIRYKTYGMLPGVSPGSIPVVS